MIIWGVIPLGSLAGGVVAELSSLSTAIAAAALLQVVVLMSTGRRLHKALTTPARAGLPLSPAVAA
jgi:hypothetical protein